MSAEPIVGMVMPNGDAKIPAEAAQLYPQGVRFISAGLGLKSLTPEGYDAVIDKIAGSAEALAEQGAQGITLSGTSLTFYRGFEFHEQLKETVRRATGLPVTTMSTGVVDGLRALGVKHVAVGTAYNDEVNRRLCRFLEDSGFDVLVIEGFGLETFGMPGKKTGEDVIALARRVFDASEDADGILLSCGGLKTLELISRIEEDCGVPVVASTPASLWASVRNVGLSGRASGYGQLLAL